MVFSNHPNFRSYFGDWRRGAFHGLGRLILKDGEEYKGGWEQGGRSGEGEHTFITMGSLTSYKGGWMHDNFSGVGILK
jgi:hypothetical protein